MQDARSFTFDTNGDSRTVPAIGLRRVQPSTRDEAELTRVYCP